MHEDEFLNWCTFVYYITDTDATLLVSVILFLATDTLIALKSTIVYGFGIYLILLMKLMYKSPRPFWVS